MSEDWVADDSVSSEGLLPQLVKHLRFNRTALREEWARRITEAKLLTAMTPHDDARGRRAAPGVRPAARGRVGWRA